LGGLGQAGKFFVRFISRSQGQTGYENRKSQNCGLPELTVYQREKTGTEKEKGKDVASTHGF
jgi:hypothetical protein